MTPIGLLRALKANIDLATDTLTFSNKKLCQGSQKLTVLPSEHVAHSIVDFETPWRHPDRVSDNVVRYAPKEKFAPLKFREHEQDNIYGTFAATVDQPVLAPATTTNSDKQQTATPTQPKPSSSSVSLSSSATDLSVR